MVAYCVFLFNYKDHQLIIETGRCTKTFHTHIQQWKRTLLHIINVWNKLSI